MTKQTVDTLCSTLGRAPTAFIIKGVSRLIRQAFYSECDREELEQTLTECAFVAKRHYERTENHRASCETFIVTSILNAEKRLRKRAHKKASHEVLGLGNCDLDSRHPRTITVNFTSSIEQSLLANVLSPTDFCIVQLIMAGMSPRAACQALGLYHVYFSRKLRPRLVSLFS